MRNVVMWVGSGAAVLAICMAVVVPAATWRELATNAEALGSFLGTILGLFGVAASALIGFQGLRETQRQQAEADRRLATEKRNAETMNLASALRAELICTRATMEALDEQASEQNATWTAQELLHHLNFIHVHLATPIFENNVSKFGWLPPDVSARVVLAYAMIDALKHRVVNDLRMFSKETVEINVALVAQAYAKKCRVISEGMGQSIIALDQIPGMPPAPELAEDLPI